MVVDGLLVEGLQVEWLVMLDLLQLRHAVRLMSVAGPGKGGCVQMMACRCRCSAVVCVF